MTIRLRTHERRTQWSSPERQSSHYFHSLIEACPDPLVTINALGQITNVNLATEQATGVARAELVGSDFCNYFIDPAKAREGYQLVFAQGFVKDYPLAIRHALGRIVYVHYNARLYRDQLGHLQGVFAVARDITMIRQAEEALYESEQRFRTIADFSSDWTYWILPDHSLRYVSASCEQISGYPPEAFYADPELLSRIIHPQDLALFTGHIHQVCERGIIKPIYFRIKTKDGQDRWIAHVCRPVLDAAGTPNGFRASNRDDTERRQMEDQVHQLAFYDELTQLPNRRLLIDRLTQAMAASKRSGRHGALIFIDLDNFKPLNDSHGHAVGDLLLIEVARRLKACVREIDTPARFGGDEFVVLLSELLHDQNESNAHTQRVTEKIRLHLAEPYVLPLNKPGEADTTVTHRCTASIGAVVFGKQNTSPDDILKWADAAMYQAKEGGRNQIHLCRDNCGPSRMAVANDEGSARRP